MESEPKDNICIHVNAVSSDPQVLVQLNVF